MNLDRIYGKVEYLLATVPETRNSDRKLICEYYKQNGININAPFAEIVLGDTPSWESITRARRKVQEQHPELSACEAVQEFRADNEGQFFLWATDKGVQ